MLAVDLLHGEGGGTGAATQCYTQHLFAPRSRLLGEVARHLKRTMQSPSVLASRGQLLRVLGLGFALAVGVGSVIGGGILRASALVIDAVRDVTLA